MAQAIDDQIQKLAQQLAPVLFPLMQTMGAANVVSSAPSGAVTGERVFRTDINLWTYYDGTRWLTLDEYEVALSTDATALITTAPTLITVAALPNSAISITQATIVYYVAVTNNGANYWPLRIADDTGIIFDTNTSAGAANTWTRLQNAPALIRSTPVHVELTAPVAKTGAPGGLYVAGTVRYRLIV